MIMAKLIEKQNDRLIFITLDNKKIITSYINSLKIGEDYIFQTSTSGYSKISDSKGNIFNVLILPN